MANKVIRRKDYKKPEFLFKKTFIDFKLGKIETIVTSKIEVVKQKNILSPLTLDFKDMDVKLIKIDGIKLKENVDYLLNKEKIVFKNPLHAKFTLEIENVINPDANKTGAGLYRAGDVFTTQCEAEAFHKIIPYQDRPDVLSEYFVTITADKKKYPVLLSNGNKVSEQDNDDGTHTVSWHDPFLKPCYLFALVAGNLGKVSGEFTTMSNRKVELAIYCEKGKENKLKYALECLKKCMKWDEDVFHREYDLDLFNIVAVSSFNAGAMENKSLNIFNDKYVLADFETASDYEHFLIDSVIAHEYFHNWSGNRVTVAFWHDLSLKEGFTIYRDHLYSRMTGSDAVVRLDEVSSLRASQFIEDAGANAHAVRPEKYIGVENIYSSTIYNKGGELIGMLHTILGDKLFFKGCDYYFSHNDGEAVTIDDFINAFESVSGISLKHFMTWYYQSGTPHVKVKTFYDDSKKALKVTFEQITYPTRTQKQKKSLVIPLKTGFVSRKTGKDVLENIIVLNKAKQTFTFKDLKEDVIISTNRSFSAPVYLEIDYTDDEKAFLMKHDSNLFNRAEIADIFITENIINIYNSVLSKEELKVSEPLISALKSSLNDKSIDKEFMARQVSISLLSAFNKLSEIDIEALKKSIDEIEKALAKNCYDDFLCLYNENKNTKEDDLSFEMTSKRLITNKALYYISLHDNDEKRLFERYKETKSMTNRLAVLSIISKLGLSSLRYLLDQDFYDRFKDNTLVITKWIRLSASFKQENVFKKAIEIMDNKAFDITIPNHVYALAGGIISNDSYHDLNKNGYEFIASLALQMLTINPAVSGWILRNAFSSFKKYDRIRQTKMLLEVEKVAITKDLPNNIYEIVSNIIKAKGE